MNEKREGIEILRLGNETSWIYGYAVFMSFSNIKNCLLISVHAIPTIMREKEDFMSAECRRLRVDKRGYSSVCYGRKIKGKLSEMVARYSQPSLDMTRGELLLQAYIPMSIPDKTRFAAISWNYEL